MQKMKRILLPICFVLIVGAGCFLAAAYFTADITKKQQAALAEKQAGGNDVADKVLEKMASSPELSLRPDEEQLRALILDLQSRREKLVRRAEELDARESQMQLAAGELQNQAKELETLRVALVAALGPLKNQRAALLRQRIVIQNTEEANLVNLGRMYAKMEPSNAARLLVNMFKTRKNDAAIKIMHNLSEKEMAAIMDEIVVGDADSRAAVEMIEQQMRVVRESSKES